MKRALLLLLTTSLILSPLGCEKHGEPRPLVAIERGMKAQIEGELSRWEQASRALAEAAPLPSSRGWDPGEDRAEIEKMKGAWYKAREAYELIEGAIAPTFPESDAATDSRYDDFLSRLGPQGDPNPFDSEGVVGMHAIERILWAEETPEEVVRFEKGLPGYRPARFPENAEEARAFKEQLAKGLVLEIEKLRTQFAPLRLDIAFAYQGLIDLAVEQAEKVDRAATGQEESRYAQSTMKDLRANYEGCLRAYRVFQPEVQKRVGGAEIDGRVMAGFERLRTAYSRVHSDSIPRPPEGWSTVSPNPAHQSTPFGQLFFAVKRESDPAEPGSLVSELAAVAKSLDLKDVIIK